MNTMISTMPSTFVFSLAKAGSVLINNIVQDLACAQGLKYQSIMGDAFEAGVSDEHISPDTWSGLQPNGYVYGGFRYLPQRVDIPILKKCKRVLLVRDPRDMLVSLYFSMKYSHPSPGISDKSDAAAKFSAYREMISSMSIDDFVLDQCQYVELAIMSYLPYLDDPLTRIFRYEDVVFDKANWVADMCSHLDWNMPGGVLDEIAARHDIRVETEAVDKHIRNVSPGDHVNKLAPSTIRELNWRLQAVLIAFRYFEMGRACHELLTSYFDNKKPRLISIMKSSGPSAIVEDLSLGYFCEDSSFIDQGTVNCLGYWIEQNGTPVQQVVSGQGFMICYVLKFIQDFQGAMLGFSAIRNALYIGENTENIGRLDFESGDQVIVKWALSGTNAVGRYFASVGVSKIESPSEFVFRQYKMREFSITPIAVDMV